MNDSACSPDEDRRTRALWSWFACVTILILVGIVALIRWSISDAAEEKWAAAQKHLAATHHTLDFMALQPPPVPDSENFYAIPALKDIALVIDDDENKGEPAERRKQLGALAINQDFRDFDLPPKEEGLDYGIEWEASRWADHHRESKVLPMPAPSNQPGKDIHAGLEAQRALIEALNAANDLPQSQIVGVWKNMTLAQRPREMPHSHHKPLRNFQAVLMTHAEAAASCGDVAAAINDICTMLRLSEGLGREPLIINTSPAISGVSSAMAPTWSALRRHPDDARMLAKLAQCLERIDVQEMDATGMRGELADSAAECDAVGHIGETLTWRGMAEARAYFRNEMSRPGGNTASLATVEFQVLINPGAVGLGNKASITDQMLTYFLEPLESHKPDALQLAAMSHLSFNKIVELDPSVFGLFANYSMSAYQDTLRRTLIVAARLNQARIACALERFFIKQSTYPDELGKLVPEFLPCVPVDPMDGHPMRYKKTGDRYRLWSLGPNGLDDGGEVKPSPHDDPAEPRLRAPDYPGDWVWSYEPLVPARVIDPDAAPNPEPKDGKRKVMIPSK